MMIPRFWKDEILNFAAFHRQWYQWCLRRSGTLKHRLNSTSLYKNRSLYYFVQKHETKRTKKPVDLFALMENTYRNACTYINLCMHLLHQPIPFLNHEISGHHQTHL